MEKRMNYLLIYNAVALNAEWATAITDDYISACILKSSVLSMEVDLVRTVGKDALLYIVKNIVNRDFANIAYDLSINYELCNDKDTQRAKHLAEGRTKGLSHTSPLIGSKK